MQRKNWSHPELVPEHFRGCTKPAEPRGRHSLLPRCSSRYPHKTLSFAVPSMTHGGRFPRAAAPALLQTVHSFLDVVCSSPAFLPIPGTHGWYEAMFSGSISFPAQRCWVSALPFF